MSHDNSKELLEGCLDQIVRLLPDEAARTMMRYAIFPGGKRIRPRFLLGCASALGARENNDLFVLGSVIEILHAASLVHDDLPAIDDDSMRRRKPSAHIQFGEGEAVLLGDLMQSVSFQACGMLSDPVLQGRAAEVLGRANTALVLGQLGDIQAVEDLDMLRLVHERKTGALFSAAALLAAVAARDTTQGEQELFLRFGLEYGVLFQYANDLRDGDGASEFIDSAAVRTEVERSLVMLQRTLNSIREISEARSGDMVELEHLSQKMTEDLHSLLHSNERVVPAYS